MFVLGSVLSRAADGEHLQAPDRVAQPGAPTGDVYHDTVLYKCSHSEASARGLCQPLSNALSSCGNPLHLIGIRTGRGI